MEQYLIEALNYWRGAPGGPPPLERTFGAEEQAERERALDRLLAGLEQEFRALPRTRAERTEVHARLTAALARFCRESLRLEDAHLRLLFEGGLSSIGTHLARAARRFDPAVGLADIFQASRNAWTACGLQLLLGRAMALTPSIFAYSMLYPYTDNYLDDPAVSGKEKLGFSRRFGARLAGETPQPANAHEACIWRLVGLIEGEFPRAEHAPVFASLQAIHQAQQQSLKLLRNGNGNTLHGEELRRTIFWKGGTSVLADGYLAAGVLAPAQARFIFHWGVLLQLADDLQDVAEDRRDGARTLFTAAAAGGTLDEVTSRTLHYAGCVLPLLLDLPAPGCAPLKQLIARSSLSLIVRSAGAAADLYSPAYLAALERHSPFRFDYLNRSREKMAPRRALMARMFECFLAGDEDEPAFPLLPNSLLPRV